MAVVKDKSMIKSIIIKKTNISSSTCSVALTVLYTVAGRQT